MRLCKRIKNIADSDVLLLEISNFDFEVAFFVLTIRKFVSRISNNIDEISLECLE